MQVALRVVLLNAARESANLNQHVGFDSAVAGIHRCVYVCEGL